jgi:hypothetical protein
MEDPHATTVGGSEMSSPSTDPSTHTSPSMQPFTESKPTAALGVHIASTKSQSSNVRAGALEGVQLDIREANSKSRGARARDLPLEYSSVRSTTTSTPLLRAASPLRTQAEVVQGRSLDLQDALHSRCHRSVTSNAGSHFGLVGVVSVEAKHVRTSRIFTAY